MRELVFAPPCDDTVLGSLISRVPMELLCNPGEILHEKHFAEEQQSHFARY